MRYNADQVIHVVTSSKSKFPLQLNLDHSESLELDEIVWIMEGLDNQEYEY